MSDCAAIHSAHDMSRLLRDASPARAPAFAQAQHEAACRDGDDGRAAFWQEVMEHLSQPAEPDAGQADAA